MATTYIVPTTIAPQLAPRGLVARLIIDRADGKPLSDEDRQAIEATYAAELAEDEPAAPPRSQPAQKPAARSAPKAAPAAAAKTPARRKAG